MFTHHLILLMLSILEGLSRWVSCTLYVIWMLGLLEESARTSGYRELDIRYLRQVFQKRDYLSRNPYFIIDWTSFSMLILYISLFLYYVIIRDLCVINYYHHIHHIIYNLYKLYNLSSTLLIISYLLIK